MMWLWRWFICCILQIRGRPAPPTYFEWVTCETERKKKVQHAQKEKKAPARAVRFPAVSARL